MAFARESNETKDTIEDIEIVFFIPGASNTDDTQFGILNVKIGRSDDVLESRSYDLLLRLQDDAAGLTHLANLASLKTYIKTRLENEVLPL